MRIGVDARLLCEPVTGIGRYTQEICSRLIARERDVHLYMPASPISDMWHSAGANVRSASFRGRLGKMLWSQTVMPHYAAKDELDVFWGATHRLPRFLSERIARVVTIHDLVWKYAGETMRPFSRLVEQCLMPQAIHAADMIMADSISTAEGIKSVFPDAKDKVRVVPLGASRWADPKPFSALRDVGVDGSYFLFVGTLEPRKNLARLLRAFAQLPPELRTSFRLVIAGGKGWGGVDINAWLTELGIDGQVILPGYVTDDQLASLYAHAEFLVMPSLYEGFGLPILESMLYGTPVITSNCSSMPEVGGNAALLVDPLCETSIANGLKLMMTDDVLRSELAHNTSTNVNRFSWESTVNESLAVFEEAIERRQMKLSYGR